MRRPKPGIESSREDLVSAVGSYVAELLKSDKLSFRLDHYCPHLRETLEMIVTDRNNEGWNYKNYEREAKITLGKLYIIEAVLPPNVHKRMEYMSRAKLILNDALMGCEDPEAYREVGELLYKYLLPKLTDGDAEVEEVIFYAEACFMYSNRYAGDDMLASRKAASELTMLARDVVHLTWFEKGIEYMRVSAEKHDDEVGFTNVGRAKIDLAQLIDSDLDKKKNLLRGGIDILREYGSGVHGEIITAAVVELAGLP
jgi:hypothetical protein